MFHLVQSHRHRERHQQDYNTPGLGLTNEGRAEELILGGVY